MEISSKEYLKAVLRMEKNLYIESKGRYTKLLKIMKSHPDYNAWRYTRRMRITSYYYSKRKKNIIYAIMYIVSCRRMNSLGRKCGIECGENVFDEGVRFYHTQGIVINGNAIIGKNCYLYGNNCIGNDGIDPKCPVFGNNVRVCVGAKIIGNVKIANDVVVAAGAIVIKDCLENGAILAGVPAKIIGYVNLTKVFLE